MSELWNELHLRSLKFKGDNDIKYLRDFGRRIQRYSGENCRCKEFWVKNLKVNPPKNYDNDSYF